MKVILFEKKNANAIAHCQVKVFEDNSAYVIGDDIEIIYEESPTASDEAIKYLISLGYEMILDSISEHPSQPVGDELARTAK